MSLDMCSPLFHLLIWVGDTPRRTASSFWVQERAFNASCTRAAPFIWDPFDWFTKFSLQP